MTFANYARYLLYAIMIISVVFTAFFYFGNVVDPIAARPEPKITDAILKYSYILFVIAVIGTIAFSLMNLLENIKSLKNLAIVVVIAAVIFFISRALASDIKLELGDSYKGNGNVPSVLKNVGTGLIATYLLLGITIVTLLYSEVVKLFK